MAFIQCAILIASSVTSPCCYPQGPTYCLKWTILFSLLGRPLCPFYFVNVENSRSDTSVLPQVPSGYGFLHLLQLLTLSLLKIHGILWTEEIAYGILKTEVEMMWLSKSQGLEFHIATHWTSCSDETESREHCHRWWQVKILQPLWSALLVVDMKIEKYIFGPEVMLLEINIKTYRYANCSLQHC